MKKIKTVVGASQPFACRQVRFSCWQYSAPTGVNNRVTVKYLFNTRPAKDVGTTLASAGIPFTTTHRLPARCVY